MRKLLMLLSMPFALAAQCNVLSTSGCPTTGSPSGWTGCANAYDACGTGPTYQSFVAGASTALPAAGNSVSTLRQPRILLTAQLSPAGVAFMTTDPTSCGGTANTGPPTCYYNQIGFAPDAASPYTGVPTGILGFIYRMKQPSPVGLGLLQIDINGWLGPLFVSSQYLASGLNFCGTYGSCHSAGGYSTWYTNSLATYDAVFSYIVASGLVVNWEPTMSGDTKTVCGIPAYGTYTEAQIQSCEAPLEAAAAKRWNINHFSVDHEPCGVQELIYGTGGNCYLSVADENTLITALSAAIRATRKNPAMLVGAGAQFTDIGGTPYTCPNAGNYWCDWVTNLNGSMDYYAVHAYPITTASIYVSQALSVYKAMCQAVPSNQICLSDESSPLRYEPTGQSGEGNSVFGCGYTSYLTDGSYAWWIGNVAGTWAPAIGFQQFAEFDTQRLLFLTNDSNNTHCSLSSDLYSKNVMLSLPTSVGVSGEGLEFAAVAGGYTLSVQGKSHISGPSLLGSASR